jgi:DNA-directed RNA polymerase subunit RPC12/RpoP
MTDIKSLVERLRNQYLPEWSVRNEAADALEEMENELVVRRTAIANLHAIVLGKEAELAEERRKREGLEMELKFIVCATEREEWVCGTCGKVFRANEVPNNASCIVCPDCRGTRMPKTMAERENWKAKYEALLSERPSYGIGLSGEIEEVDIKGQIFVPKVMYEETLAKLAAAREVAVRFHGWAGQGSPFSDADGYTDMERQKEVDEAIAAKLKEKAPAAPETSYNSPASKSNDE